MKEVNNASEESVKEVNNASVSNVCGSDNSTLGRNPVCEASSSNAPPSASNHAGDSHPDHLRCSSVDASRPIRLLTALREELSKREASPWTSSRTWEAGYISALQWVLGLEVEEKAKVARRQKWRVMMTNNDPVEWVRAERLMVLDGALVFSSTLQISPFDIIMRVFAPGSWLDVEHDGSAT